MTIKFRPHHFLCAFCFQGQGYSPAFVTNFYAVLNKIKAGEDKVLIEIVAETDSLCEPCPHRKKNKCQTEDKIAILDQAHAEVLEIAPTEKITWQDAKQKIFRKLTLDKFHEICATCSWKKLGVCETVLSDYLKS